MCRLAHVQGWLVHQPPTSPYALAHSLLLEKFTRVALARPQLTVGHRGAAAGGHYTVKFRPVVGKARAKKGGEEALRTYVGNDVLNADIALNNLRTPFDSSIVTRLDVQVPLLPLLLPNLVLSLYVGATLHQSRLWVELCC